MSGPPVSAAHVPAPAGTGASIRADIARAAERTGEDFNFLLAQAKIESSLNPQAKAATSSAAGLFQFTNATWLSTLERHGAKHGLGWASAAIANGRITDSSLAGHIMGLRYDPAASALMAGELAGDNRDEMMRTLGRQPNAARNPDASATALLPAASAANRGIFRTGSGTERSLAEVMAIIEAKVEGAMTGELGAGLPPVERGIPAPPPARAMPVTTQIAGGRSMSDSLQSMFGNNPQAAPPAVKAAYARFERFGL